MILIEKYNFRLKIPYITYLIAIILILFHILEFFNLTLFEKTKEPPNLILETLFKSSNYQFYYNLIYLLMYGDNVEDVIGHFKYLITFWSDPQKL